MTTPTSAMPEPDDTTPLDAQENPMDATEQTTPIPPVPPSTAPLTDDVDDLSSTTRPMDPAPTTAAATPIPTAGTRPRVRVGTTVWGLVVVVIGLGLLAIAAGAVFDVQLATIGLIAAAGIALLVGSLLTATGRRR